MVTVIDKFDNYLNNDRFTTLQVSILVEISIVFQRESHI